MSTTVTIFVPANRPGAPKKELGAIEVEDFNPSKSRVRVTGRPAQELMQLLGTARPTFDLHTEDRVLRGCHVERALDGDTNVEVFYGREEAQSPSR